MTGLEIALLIFGILIFFGIVIVVILIAAGVFETKKINKILSGNFSLHPLNDSSKHMIFAGAPTNKDPAAFEDIILSSSSTVDCKYYDWVFKDNFIELAGTNLILQSETLDSGSRIRLQPKKDVFQRNQWKYDEAGLTWCLVSNDKLCMFNQSDKLILDDLSVNTGFSWIPVEALKPTACSAS